MGFKARKPAVLGKARQLCSICHHKVHGQRDCGRPKINGACKCSGLVIDGKVACYEAPTLRVNHK